MRRSTAYSSEVNALSSFFPDDPVLVRKSFVITEPNPVCAADCLWERSRRNSEVEDLLDAFTLEPYGFVLRKVLVG
ncbi:hypothetical protein MUK42_37065 [Musa troglodytarum]|uniref:Uncharacterized protein n=1 Tax=Musa troglodytarum TaxID=320322 RepID=A0A9E7JBI4_9LILI|nr:hypothetical protein MUK42_37065 [Musa troglodytarum]